MSIWNLPHAVPLRFGFFSTEALPEFKKMGGRQEQRTFKPLINKDLLVGLLSIYDMCKAVDKTMVMTDIRVMEKHGGKSRSWKVE